MIRLLYLKKDKHFVVFMKKGCIIGESKLTLKEILMKKIIYAFMAFALIPLFFSCDNNVYEEVSVDEAVKAVSISEGSFESNYDPFGGSLTPVNHARAGAAVDVVIEEGQIVITFDAYDLTDLDPDSEYETISGTIAVDISNDLLSTTIGLAYDFEFTGEGPVATVAMNSEFSYDVSDILDNWENFNASLFYEISLIEVNGYDMTEEVKAELIILANL